MKRIISAIILITMLLTTFVMVVPASAAERTTTVSTPEAFNAALKAASGNTTITIAEGATISPTSFTWPTAASANVTINGTGTIDFSAAGNLNVECGLVLAEGLTVVFGTNQYVFANGNPLVIEKNITHKYKDSEGNFVTPKVTFGNSGSSNVTVNIYGGSNSKTLNKDTYLEIQSGFFTRIYGGNNGGTLNGNTTLIVGTKGNVNKDGVNWSDGNHETTVQIFGGSNSGSTLNGNTNVTVGQYGYADYVVGGNQSGGKITGTTNMYFSGHAYGLYGGSRGGNTMNDVNLVMLGGEVQDIMGANPSYDLGSSSDPSNVQVRLLGGTIYRRVYAGCYNDYGLSGWGSECRVIGNLSLIIGEGVTFALNKDSDNSLNANSRYKNSFSDEVKSVVFLSQAAYNAHNSKVGKGSGASANHTPSTRHILTTGVVTEEFKSVFTETCSCCNHSAKAILSLKNEKDDYLYTGSAIECAELTYEGTLWSGDIYEFGYENNVQVGTAKAFAKIYLGANPTTLEKVFNIRKNSGYVDGKPDDDYTQNGSIEVSYTVAETYVFTVPASIALGAKDVTTPLEVSVTKTILDVQNAFKVYVKSANGFKVVDSKAEEALSYTMTYGDKIADGTANIHLMTIRWNDEDNSESCTLGLTRKDEPVKGSMFSDTLTFGVDLISDGAAPKIDGEDWTTDAYDVGDGSLLYVKTNVAPTYSQGVEKFENYVNRLKGEGYTLYTTNQIGDNHFATLYTSKQIINVMYIDYYKDIRVVTDLRSTFDLPGLEFENSYKAWANYTPNLTLISGEEIKWAGRLGYVYQLDDGSFFIIDGGYLEANDPSKTAADFTVDYSKVSGMPKTSREGRYGSAMPYIQQILEKYAPDPNNIIIAAWFITHTHEDHMGAFIDLSVLDEYADLKSRITIEQFIYNKSSDAEAEILNGLKGNSNVSGYHAAYQAAIDSWGDKMISKVKAHPGQVFYLRNLEMTVYTSQDLLHGSEHYITGQGVYDKFDVRNYIDPDTGKYQPYWCHRSNYASENKETYINNTSIVVNVEFMGKNTLYLADSSSGANPFIVAPIFGDVLGQTQILQVAHHGYADTFADSTYKAVLAGGNLEYVFWPTNNDHFYGKLEGVDYETTSDRSATISASFNNQLIASGVTVYVHGPSNIIITDFETYVPEELSSKFQKFDKDTWISDLQK